MKISGGCIKHWKQVLSPPIHTIVPKYSTGRKFLDWYNVWRKTFCRQRKTRITKKEERREKKEERRKKEERSKKKVAVPDGRPNNGRSIP